MATHNPYEPSAEIINPSVLPVVWRWPARGATIGFLIGAALPVGLGMLQLQQISVYNASLPPGTATCGNPVLEAFGMIFLLGPFGGMIGSLSGAAVGGMLSAFTPRPR